ncbi:hypothetical protein ISU10_14320 [Nocardioides agariphilus]|jgi:uncharacterized membrane protein YczE|uniref:Uncharacterized protein n=1 Tax=Nocardioides agariphilus TaxID=433664 RepID=A0A930VQ29_9ACTN|nr:hypothetical protein [Nocardioides agariphilus]MBF4768938.1 hypothetical protein [Nocardioides agariphilus]
MPDLPRVGLLLAGCVVLGLGVAMLLTADLGSDGYSTFVNGLAMTVGVSFWVMNIVVGSILVGLAAARRVRPGLGTITQVVVVGVVISALLDLWSTPDPTWGRAALLVLAFPVLALGIAAYLGSDTGAGPAEAAALAWDPPVRFRWSYSLVQGGGALGGWLLGATVGVGTVGVVLALGPLIDLASRVLRMDVHQSG